MFLSYSSQCFNIILNDMLWILNKCHVQFVSCNSRNKFDCRQDGKPSKFDCPLRAYLQTFQLVRASLEYCTLRSTWHDINGFALYCVDACCEFVLFLSVKPVHVLCAQVVCTFGSMVFASILLVRGIWSGVTYIRENRYNYIHRIDNDDSRWSRVQTAGWYFAFLLCGQTHTHTLHWQALE